MLMLVSLMIGLLMAFYLIGDGRVEANGRLRGWINAASSKYG
jgi:hypothetical protein